MNAAGLWLSRRLRTWCAPAVLLLGALSAPGVQAGALVVSHDSATLNSASPGVARFSQNLVQFLDRDGTPGGRVLVFNRQESLGNNARLEDTLFGSAVAGLGYSLSEGDANRFTLDQLDDFDAVLFAGRIRDSQGRDAKDDDVIVQYLAGGGGVYIAFGTPIDPVVEAAYWNSLLDDYGIAAVGSLNNRVGLVGGGSGPLFAGVDSLFAGNGQDLRLTGGNPLARIDQLAPGSATLGLVASIEIPAPVVAVPEPGGLALAGLALLSLAARRRGRRPTKADGLGRAAMEGRP